MYIINLTRKVRQELSSLVSMYFSMNEWVYLDWHESGYLRVASVDHDNTTILYHTIPINTESRHKSYYPQSCVHRPCKTILTTLSRMTSTDTVRLIITSDAWELVNIDNQSLDTWSVTPDVTSPIPERPETDCRLEIDTSSLVAYIQKLSLCESTVRIAADAEGTITLTSTGEIIALTIRHPLDRHSRYNIVPTQTVNSSVITKYTRALVPIFQQTETVTLYIKHAAHVTFELDSTMGGRTYIVLNEYNM
jgi:hypothetical protein